MPENASMIGYTRVSKADGSQVHHLQHDALIAAGVDPKRIYQDSISGARDSRPGLDACLAALAPGDTLVIWKLDRLGRSLRHLVNTVGELTARGIGLKVLTGEGAMIDTTTASGMVRGTTDTFGLRNASGATRLMRFYGSIDAADGNNQTLGVKLALNGTPIDTTECRAFTGSGGQEAKLVTSWMISMAVNDEVSLFIANHSAATDIELKRARLVASEVR